MSELENESKKRLSNFTTTKMKTIMIGSLSIIEEEMSQLCDNDIRLRNMYNDIRQKILDLGNTQIRNYLQEIDKYTIKSNLYTVNYKVEGKKDE